MTKERGKFVVFEGVDGGGKTTMRDRLGEYLAVRGYDVVITRQPGGIEETIPFRKVLFDERMKGQGNAQLLVVCADRAIHLLFQIAPELRAGKMVICDRFDGATFAYQGEAGVPREVIEYINGVAIKLEEKMIRPDITFFLDVDPRVGISRKKQQGDTNHFDDAELGLHEKRREIFSQLAEEHGWNVIDTTQLGEDVVFERILTVLREKGILMEGQQ